MEFVWTAQRLPAISCMQTAPAYSATLAAKLAQTLQVTNALHASQAITFNHQI